MDEVNNTKKQVYKVLIHSRHIKEILRKYKNFLSKKDISRIINLSVKNPDIDFEALIIEFLERKYNIDNTFDLSGPDKESLYNYKDIVRELGISRKRFYFLLNYIGKYVIMKPIGKIIKKGNIIDLPHEKLDRRYVKELLKKKKGIEKKVLLNPGPVLTSYGVKNALIQYDICHRDSDFEKLLIRLSKNSLKIFDADDNFTALFISGSGTAGMETAISSSIHENKKILILSNGIFGERLYEIAAYHKIKTVCIKKQWGEIFDIDEIKKILASDPEISAIAMNHHETSVGILNPVHEVGILCKKFDKLFIVDAISSLGAEKISVKKDNIDICISSSNKCIHSFSGITLLCVNNRVWNLIKGVKPRSYYLDLKKYYEYSKEFNQTPYTPFVSSFFALDKAILELLAEGIDVRRLKYMQLNSILKLELSKLGFKFFTNYDCQSHTILTVKVPEDIEFKRFYNMLKQKGFIIYNCKPPLADKYFQVANMGCLNKSIIYDFIFAVKDTLKKLRAGNKKQLV